MLTWSSCWRPTCRTRIWKVLVARAVYGHAASACTPSLHGTRSHLVPPRHAGRAHVTPVTAEIHWTCPAPSSDHRLGYPHQYCSCRRRLQRLLPRRWNRDDDVDWCTAVDLRVTRDDCRCRYCCVQLTLQNASFCSTDLKTISSYQRENSGNIKHGINR